MACICDTTAISYTRPDGNGGVAPVRFVCAEHSATHRTRNRAISGIHAKLFPRLRLALPPARLLLGVR